MYDLSDYGWNDERASAWAQRQIDGAFPARVVTDFGRIYKVATPDVRSACISGALEYTSGAVDMPKIGDWVAVEVQEDGSTIIQEVLARTTEIVRAQPGRPSDKQTVATNVDIAFIMQSLNHDFSVERLERYIFQLASQDLRIVIILNKSDLADDAADKQAQLESLGVTSVVMSATGDETVADIEQLIGRGQTAIILGSSGAGKSTLTNRLLGEDRQAIGAIRERDSKGRHTTVHRELFMLPGGGMIIDTPGIRELQLWGSIGDLDESFPDIAAQMKRCQYRNCSHEAEAGCAVQAALVEGSIKAERYRSYRKFRLELEAFESRHAFIQQRRTHQAKESQKRRQRRAAERSMLDEIQDID